MPAGHQAGEEPRFDAICGLVADHGGLVRDADGPDAGAGRADSDAAALRGDGVENAVRDGHAALGCTVALVPTTPRYDWRENEAPAPNPGALIRWVLPPS
jgi:hypothetical protein